MMVVNSLWLMAYGLAERTVFDKQNAKHNSCKTAMFGELQDGKIKGGSKPAMSPGFSGQPGSTDRCIETKNAKFKKENNGFENPSNFPKIFQLKKELFKNKNAFARQRCKGYVAQWIEHPTHAGADAGSRLLRKSRRTCTNVLSKHKDIKERKKQARNLDKTPFSRRGISHELKPQNIPMSCTLKSSKNSIYKKVSIGKLLTAKNRHKFTNLTFAGYAKKSALSFRAGYFSCILKSCAFYDNGTKSKRLNFYGVIG